MRSFAVGMEAIGSVCETIYSGMPRGRLLTLRKPGTAGGTLAHVSSEMNNLGHVSLRRSERRVPRNRSPRVAMIGFPIDELLSEKECYRMCARIFGPVDRLIAVKTQQGFEVLIREYRESARDVLGAERTRSRSAVAPGCST